MGQYDIGLNVCDVARSRTPRDLAKLVGCSSEVRWEDIARREA
jgi:hypothetical protein